MTTTVSTKLNLVSPISQSCIQHVKFTPQVHHTSIAMLMDSLAAVKSILLL